MDWISKELKIQVFRDWNELNTPDRELIQLARGAAEKAYAPYSAFQVGCALRLANGIIVTGSNQENMAFPSGLCAERVAVFHAGAEYPGVAILEMAVTVITEKADINQPAACCGSCLQALSEYEHRYKTPIRTLLMGESGEVWVTDEGTKTFMPFQFQVPELKNK